MPHLPDQPVHLGPGGTAQIEPPFTGPDWYEAYETRHAADGLAGRLVTQYSFTESWPMWEMHPHGAEMVLCIAGTITQIQEHPGAPDLHITLNPGDYAINPPGIWHTADITPGTEAACLFITPGAGTMHRPR